MFSLKIAAHGGIRSVAGLLMIHDCNSTKCCFLHGGLISIALSDVSNRDPHASSIIRIQLSDWQPCVLVMAVFCTTVDQQCKVLLLPYFPGFSLAEPYILLVDFNNRIRT